MCEREYACGAKGGGGVGEFKPKHMEGMVIFCGNTLLRASKGLLTN